MTIDPDTSPEAVERLAKSLAFVANRTGMTVEKCEQVADDAAATLRALSAALEKESAEKARMNWERPLLSQLTDAEAALEEALEVMQRVNDYRYDPRIGIELNMLEAFLARHHKEETDE